MPFPRLTTAIAAVLSLSLAMGALAESAPDDAAPLGVLVPSVGPSISGHDWIRFDQIGETLSQTVLTLSYAVPETDHVLITARCTFDAPGPSISMHVTADLEGLDDVLTRLVIENDLGQVEEIIGVASFSST